MLSILKMAAVLVAAMIVGNNFLKEIKKAKIKKLPWYAPYLTWPGILILLALSLPIWLHFLR